MNYTKVINTYPSSNQENTITYYKYIPQGEVRGILQIVHGMCEYIERYEHVAEYFAAHGILVCGNDHLGHGKSVDSINDLGYFAKENGWRYLYEDVHQLTQIMQQEYADMPYFILGHSMGSFITRLYLSHYGSELTGAIIMGTSGPYPLVGMGKAFSSLLASIKGGKYRSKLIYNVAFATYNKGIKNPVNEFAWLSNDPEISRAYAINPYCNFVFTTQGFKDLFTLLQMVSQKSWARSLPNNLPILLSSGTSDPVGQYGQGVKKVYDRLKEAGSTDVEIELYAGDRHELVNEYNKEQVLADIWSWLAARI